MARGHWKKRRCNGCKRLVKTLLFERYKGRDGLLHKRGTCRKCHYEAQKRWSNENAAHLKEWRRQYNLRNRGKRIRRLNQCRVEARAYTNALKAKTPCADCGRKWPPVAMDFDHVRGKKLKTIATMVAVGYRLDTIQREVAKCEIVCACCHRIRTYGTKQRAKRHNLRSAAARVRSNLQLEN